MDKEIKVLLIDDETDFTQPMAFWLKAKGYSVIVASSGESGIKMAKEKNPDVVFMDLNMPVMDGLATLEKIRAFDKELPVIVISAYVEDQDKMRKLSSLGISGVFYKGKDFSESLALLESTLRTHRKLKK